MERGIITVLREAVGLLFLQHMLKLSGEIIRFRLQTRKFSE
jgi:hypothetical protein